MRSAIVLRMVAMGGLLATTVSALSMLSMATNNEASSCADNNNKVAAAPESAASNQEWDVDLYKKHSFVHRYGSSLIDELNPQPGERILDVGCGSGELAHQIAERGSCWVMGVDDDASMIEQAQAKYPHLEFVQSDITKFQLTSHVEPLDAIFSNAALHWVKDAEAAVAVMSGMLKPGGRYVVEFGGRGNIHHIVKASLAVLERPEKDNPWYFPGIAEYSHLLEKHGIEVLSASLYDRPTRLEEGPAGMYNWLQMFGGVLLNDVSNEAKDGVIQEIVSKLRAESELFDGEAWNADYRRIRITGKKVEQ